MAFIYFIIITPIAVIVRLAGKDLFKIKLNTKTTYWINRKKISDVLAQYINLSLKSIFN